MRRVQRWPNDWMRNGQVIFSQVLTRRLRILILLMVFPLLGLIGDITKDPANILEKYMSLDKKGARLEPMGLEALKPYTLWTEEPAWGQLVVISDYQVSHDPHEWKILHDLEVKIPVTFQVVGAMLWDSATFVFEPREEVIYFRIRAIEARWRIVEPMTLPHVGRKRLIDFVRLALLQETEENRVDRLRILKESLEKAR